MGIEEKKEYSVSVIIPVFNGRMTIEKTLQSLFRQSKKFGELIIVDDASTDRSSEIIRKVLTGKRTFTIIQNKRRLGLAKTYNEGIRASSGDLIVTLHQDVLLEKDSLKKLTDPFADNKIVAATHIVTHPMEIWNTYNFWQKCFFARLAGKEFSGIDGKFDCFRRKALETVGFFDSVNFHTAGEDGDMRYKLKKLGRIALTEARIIHVHQTDKNFGWRDIVYKQKQYSEAQGTLLAHGRITRPVAIMKSFFREILLVGLFFPYIWLVFGILILAYSFFYTKKVYLNEYKDKRVLILPFFNIYLLVVSFVYSLKGLVYGKQRI